MKPDTNDTYIHFKQNVVNLLFIVIYVKLDIWLVFFMVLQGLVILR
jgi:hypothetical protein